MVITSNKKGDHFLVFFVSPINNCTHWKDFGKIGKIFSPLERFLSLPFPQQKASFLLLLAHSKRRHAAVSTTVAVSILCCHPACVTAWQHYPAFCDSGEQRLPFDKAHYGGLREQMQGWKNTFFAEKKKKTHFSAKLQGTKICRSDEHFTIFTLLWALR